MNSKFKLISIIKKLFTSRELYVVDYCEVDHKVTFVSDNIYQPYILTLDNIVKDNKLLTRLHPSQSCYIGLLYGRYLKINSEVNDPKLIKVTSDEIDSNFIGYDRNYNVMFFDKKTNLPSMENIIKVASSYELINLFKPITAFNIGFTISSKVRWGVSGQSTQHSSQHGENVIRLV